MVEARVEAVRGLGPSSVTVESSGSEVLEHLHLAGGNLASLPRLGTVSVDGLGEMRLNWELVVQVRV